MIRAVLFDLDDTLCDDTGQMYASIREVAALVGGVEPDVLGDAYFRISHHYWTFEIHRRPPEPLARVRERLWAESLASLGLPVLPPETLAHLAARYGEAREKTPPPFPDAEATLAALRDSGLKLGLVTNGVSESHLGKLKRLGLGHYFQTILMPDLTGFAKPDPRQFHLACTRLGVAPDEAAHVGDSLVSDIHGAVEAGLTAVWFNPSQKPRPENSAEPHHTIHQLSSIIPLVKR